MALRLFLGALDVSLLVRVDVAGLLDLLAAALGLDEFPGRFAIVAIGGLVAFAFVARGLAHGFRSSSSAVNREKKTRRQLCLFRCTGSSLRSSSSSRSRSRACGRSASSA